MTGHVAPIQLRKLIFAHNGPNTNQCDQKSQKNEKESDGINGIGYHNAHLWILFGEQIDHEDWKDGSYNKTNYLNPKKCVSQAIYFVSDGHTFIYIWS